MKTKPVKHLTDCKICFFVGEDGYRTRDKSICKKCEAYNKCVAKQNDRVMQSLGFK